ncbi:MAG TPA: DUF4197 domain-containing protein [Syntrophales bacterium]|jgi:hypothetical protein|nr:DUF4197 domain-containing protein [Syntrophales bacterium]
MKRIMWFFALLWAVGAASPAGAGILDDILERLPDAKGTASLAGPDQKTTIAGLKEALAVGTKNAVNALSKQDGYFGNELVKILLPEKVRTAADMASRLGFRKQVDRFTLSMNRAAEAAAPKAADLFADAIRDMSFEDARKILQGGDTAATDYFRARTSEKLYAAFKPAVAANMNRVGVTKAYKDMMAPVESLPLVPKESIDLDHYVTGKALDGLFLMIGSEEKKIRTDPAARVTDILKTVFGK